MCPSSPDRCEAAGKKPSTGKNFVMQAGILAMAGIFCRIIGILYRSPLTSIIGDEGNGYYTTAYNLYAIILLISSYSIPSAVSKVIAARLATGEYKSARRIFKCAIVYVVVVGGIAALFTFLMADVLTGEASARVLRIFAPTIFMSGLLGVLRGFFQAHGTMVPTSVSQIIEQIVNAAMSVGMAVFFISLGSVPYFGSEAVAGACGSAVGTGAGVVVAFIFMLAYYLRENKKITAFIDKGETHRNHRVISNSRAFIVIAAMVTPIVLSTFIYNFSTSLNQEIFAFIQERLRGWDEVSVATQYGIFAGKAVVITNIPIAISAAMSSAIIPVISSSLAAGKKEEMKKHIGEAVHSTMLIAVPAFMGMMVLSRPVVGFLFPQRSSLVEAGYLLRVISFSVILYSLSTVTNGCLQASGKVLHPVRNAAVALVCQTVLLIVLLRFTGLGIYALAVVMVTYSGLMCVFNQVSLARCFGYRQELMKTLVKPLIASSFMGVVAYFAYEAVFRLTNVSRIALIAAVILSIPAYALPLIRIGGIEEADFSHMPGGRTVASRLKRLGILKRFHSNER